MGLFDKKECGVCGNKVGMLGSRKVEDGTICSDCCKKLSPFFSERKKSTVADIEQQLAYREQNRQNLNQFNATRTLGEGSMKVIIDDNQRKFVVSRKSDFRAENADIIDFSQVSNVRYEVEEERHLVNDNDDDDNRFNSQQYDYDYNIVMHISVNHPYFSEIQFKINNFSIDNRYSHKFHECEQEANEIVMALSGNGMQGGMGMGMNGGYQQMGGFSQQQNMGYQQQPNMQGGFNQQQNMGYQQQPNMQGGYQQQGYQQQPNMQQGYQQQNNMQGGYQQPQQNNQFNQSGQGAQWFCPNCGTPNTANFCQSCGTQKP